MWNIFVFAFERAIAYSPLGLLAAMFAGFLLGRSMVKANKSVLFRTSVYAGIGAVGVMWDYATQRVNEFSQISLFAQAVLLIAAFLWVALIALPFVIAGEKKKKSNHQKPS